VPIQDYGFYKLPTQATLNSDFIANLGCSAADKKCLSSLSSSAIIEASGTVLADASTLDPAIGFGEVLRPVRDGTFITSSLTSSTTFPKQTKPILVTTVREEAAYVIYHIYEEPVSTENYPLYVRGSYSEKSTELIVNSTYYDTPTGVDSQDADARVQLQVLGTDGIWRCPSWTFARSWSRAGAKAYVGEFVIGATYPENRNVAACNVPGVVCHQDDIEIVFGTVPNPTTAQSKATAEAQARIAAFLKTGDPNPTSATYGKWSPATTSDVRAIKLGNNGGLAPVNACTPTFWGGQVLYDYQIYGL
jgi:carboxylesterase type B